MRLTLTLFIALVPAVAFGQAPGDTVQVVVPADKNCADFRTRMAAQGHFLRMQFITGTSDAHSLDADGNGIACESIERIRRVQVADSLWFYTEEHPTMLRCVDTTVVVEDYLEDVQAAVWGEGGHPPLHKKRTCVDVINGLQQNQ